jgi:hypothetical protein
LTFGERRDVDSVKILKATNTQQPISPTITIKEYLFFAFIDVPQVCRHLSSYISFTKKDKVHREVLEVTSKCG